MTQTSHEPKMHYWASRGLKAKSQAVLGTPRGPAPSLELLHEGIPGPHSPIPAQLECVYS